MRRTTILYGRLTGISCIKNVIGSLKKDRNTHWSLPAALRSILFVEIVVVVVVDADVVAVEVVVEVCDCGGLKRIRRPSGHYQQPSGPAPLSL